MKQPHHGILGEKGFTYIDTRYDGKATWAYSGDSIHTVKHIGEVYDLALSCGLENIWIHTTKETFATLQDSFISDASAKYHTGKPELAKYAYFEVYRLQSSYAPKVGIHFTAHKFSKWEIDETHTDKEVYIAVAYLEDLLNIQLRYSTGSIGQDLIRKTSTGRKSKNLEACESDLTLFIRNTGTSIPWHRPLTPEEASMKWLHMVDKNANFLASSNVQLGIGNYERVVSPSFSKYDVGLWDVSIEGSSIYENKDMPSACRLLLSEDRRGWLYTQTVQLLFDLGYHLNFHEVLIWPRPSRSAVLEEWQKLLSNAYTELRTNFTKYSNEEARDLAKDMLKGMYVKGLSWLTMDIDENRGDYIDRPDWYHIVMAEAYQRMIRNIMTWEKVGIRPVLMNLDALVYPSNEEEITQALPDIRMEVKSGHYKLVYSLPLEECKHLFTPEATTGSIQAELKKLAREKGYHV